MPNWNLASVFRCSDRKRSCHDERLLPTKRFCSDEELLRTRLEIPLLRELAASSIQRDTPDGRNTSTVAAFPSAMSIVSIPRKELSVYMSRFRFWLDGRRLRNMARKGARPHVLIPYSCRDTAVGALVVELIYLGPMHVAVDSCNYFFCLDIHAVSTLR